MSWFNRLSIKFKILTIPAIAIIGFVLFLLFIVNSGAKNTARLAEIEDTYFPVLELANNNITLLERMGEMMSSAVTTGEIDMLDTAVQMGEKIKANLDQQAALAPLQSQTLKDIKQRLQKHLDLSSQLTRQMIDGSVDFSKLASMSEKKRAAEDALATALKAFRDDSHQSFINTVTETKETEASNLKVGAVIGLVTIVVLLIVALSITTSVLHNVKAISNSLQNIAQGEGDLTQRLPQTSRDELGDLVHWFNVFIDKLHGTIGNVVEVIQPLMKVAQELNTVASETARTTADQSSASELVSRSMSDMLDSVTNVAHNASAAAQAATDADGKAKEGYSIVQSTVESINDLAEAVERAAEVISKLETDSESVGNILGVIKGVAEQTNLLALNAAIEAARAGEQGRGFAVVADEVRTLASRTQDSTHEIQSVIEQLQGAAQSAVSVMEQGKERARISVDKAVTTGESLKTITTNVASITDMNQQIASTTEEQKHFAESIEKNISSMRDASKASEQRTETVSTLSNSLEDLARQLHLVATQFRV